MDLPAAAAVLHAGAASPEEGTIPATVVFQAAANFGNHFGGQRFSEGRAYNGGRDYSRERGYYGGRGWSDRGYYRGGGLYFGYGAPYVYGPSYYYPGSCNPAAHYDQWGNGQPYPGCYVDPYYP
jgi:hypothetical protein